jgi:hypothetical protein
MFLLVAMVTAAAATRSQYEFLIKWIFEHLAVPLFAKSGSAKGVPILILLIFPALSGASARIGLHEIS